MGKLVRDKVPEVLRGLGKTPRVRVLHDDKEYLQALQDKLQEEVKEYAADPSLEELADVVEVVEALVELVQEKHGEKKFERIRGEKRELRGAFVSRQYLLD